jgi:hypothetical protein
LSTLIDCPPADQEKLKDKKPTISQKLSSFYDPSVSLRRCQTNAFFFILSVKVLFCNRTSTGRALKPSVSSRFVDVFYNLVQIFKTVYYFSTNTSMMTAML